jgi:arylsulfatase
VRGDTATPVTDDYTPEKSVCNGQVRWVRIDLGDDAKDVDHYVTGEEPYRGAVTPAVALRASGIDSRRVWNVTPHGSRHSPEGMARAPHAA